MNIPRIGKRISPEMMTKMVVPTPIPATIVGKITFNSSFSISLLNLMPFVKVAMKSTMTSIGNSVWRGKKCTSIGIETSAAPKPEMPTMVYASNPTSIIVIVVSIGNGMAERCDWLELGKTEECK